MKRIVALVLVVAAVAGWWFFLRRDPSAAGKVRYRTAKVDRGQVIEGVAASGTVQPVELIQVGTQVSGVIQELRVDFNSKVTAKQVIALLDARRLQSQVDQDLAAVGRYVYHKGNVYSGVAACEGCHGPKGHGTTQLPRLAGQRPMYIEQQIKQFNTRERNNDNAVMHSIADKLTELETKAVATYLSGME